MPPLALPGYGSNNTPYRHTRCLLPTNLGPGEGTCAFPPNEGFCLSVVANARRFASVCTCFGLESANTRVISEIKITGRGLACCADVSGREKKIQIWENCGAGQRAPEHKSHD